MLTPGRQHHSRVLLVLWPPWFSQEIISLLAYFWCFGSYGIIDCNACRGKSGQCTFTCVPSFFIQGKAIFFIQGKATPKRTGSSLGSWKRLWSVTSSHSWLQTKMSPAGAQIKALWGVTSILCFQVESMRYSSSVPVRVAKQPLFSRRVWYSQLPGLGSSFPPICSDPGKSIT